MPAQLKYLYWLQFQMFEVAYVLQPQDIVGHLVDGPLLCWGQLNLCHVYLSCRVYKNISGHQGTDSLRLRIRGEWLDLSSEKVC